MERHAPTDPGRKALEELRQVEALDAVAAEIHGMVGDKRLDGREFDPFWSEAERL